MCGDAVRGVLPAHRVPIGAPCASVAPDWLVATFAHTTLSIGEWGVEGALAVASSSMDCTSRRAIGARHAVTSHILGGQTHPLARPGAGGG